MKKTLLFVFLSSLLVPTAVAQDLARAKSVIAALSSKDMHGRSPAFKGDKKAADYIQTLFQQAGLQPVQGAYQQPFSYDTQIFPKQMSLVINGKKLTPGVDFIIDPISSSGKGRAELLYLDSIFFTSNPETIAAQNFTFKKKAIVYDQKYYAKLKEFPLDLIEKIYSAACLIEINHSKLTMSIASKPMSVPVFQLGKTDVNTIRTGHCRFNVYAEWKQHYTSQNLIGLIPGAVHPDSFIVFSAHYDHLGHLGKHAYFPGANDNASGIAMLNELAQYYSDSSHRPGCSLVFLAFGAEEAGLIGSRYFTQHPLIDLKGIKFLLNIDIVGTGDESITVVNATEHPLAFSRLDSLNKTNHLLPAVNKRGKAANSDHYFFSQQGVPAFFIYTNGKQKAYHDVFDVAETLPLSKFSELFKLFTLFSKTL